MKLRIALALALAPPLMACPGPITSPSQVAQHTLADEQARLRCEQGYKLTRTIGEMAVDIPGLVSPTMARRLLSIDDRLGAILNTCRAAYRAFNATDLLAAAAQMDAAADEVRTVIGRNQD